MVNRRRKPRSFTATDELWDQLKEEAASSGESVSNVITNAISRYFQSQTVRRSSWETDDSDAWYDERKWYTFSQDKFGHSAKIDVTIPKMVAGEVAGLVESGRIPELRTPQDFYRNAIRHMAYRVGKDYKEEGLLEVAHVQTLQDRIINDQAEAAETQSLIDSMTEMLNDAIDRGQLSFANQRIKYLWDGSSSISERFREEYMERLREIQRRIDNQVELQERSNGSAKPGTVTLDDGTRIKNGVELAERRRRRTTHV